MGAQQYAQILKKLATGMISVTGALVLLIGSWVWFAEFSSPPDYVYQTRTPSSIPNVMPIAPDDMGDMATGDLQQSAAEDSLQARPQGDVEKAPSPSALDKKNKPSVETLAIDCLKDGMRLELNSQARRVRLKMKPCQELNLSLDQSTLVNRANGFEATLFKIEDGGFTSDYISLVDGQNQLLYQIQGVAGSRAVGEVVISYKSN